MVIHYSGRRGVHFNTIVLTNNNVGCLEVWIGNERPSDVSVNLGGDFRGAMDSHPLA